MTTFQVDGEPVELPYTDVDGVSLQKSGNYVELNSECDLSVLWDGRSMVLVEANKEIFGGKVEGLCGNCNDDPSDDLTGKSGVDHTQPDKWDAYHDFGKTFRVEDDSDMPIEDEAL